MRHGLLCVLLLPALLSAAPASPEPGAFRAVILSDFNGPYGSTTYPPGLRKAIGRVLNEWKPEVVLSAGDVVAGQKLGLSSDVRRAMWRTFDRDVTGPLRDAKVPYAFVVGNHDGSSVRGPDGRFVFEEDRSALAAYWRGRKPPLDFADDARFPFMFSFVLRDVFFLVVDASSASLQDRPWVEAQLGSARARRAGMRVVIGHLPLFGVSEGRSRAGEVLSGGEDLRLLFEKYGVHTYISGHHAAFYPARRGRLNLLASGGIGGRDLVGHTGTARSTVTLAEFDARRKVISLRTFDVDTGAEIDVTNLPPFLDGFGGRVVRVRDLR